MIARLSSRALLAATALGAMAVASPASAQRIDRIVAFGDSYADDNNLLQLLNIDPRTTQIYTTGRFSGGTNYIDTLSFLLQVPQENFAIGGAQARNQNGELPTFGLPYQVDQFLNVGTQSPVFPTIAPAFDRGDLVTVSIGGNDARQFEQITTAGGTPTFTVQTSIASARTQLDRLVNAGAPTISFLAGNTAQLPEVATNPAAQALRNSFSTAYNSGVQNILTSYADRGVIVHYLDLSVLLDRVRTNGAAYGLPNGVVCPLTAANVISGCAGYLFYVDNLHLSSDGFRVVGQYVQRQLQAPLNIGSTGDLALDGARQFGRTLNSRMDLGSPRDGEVLEGARLFITGDQFSRDVGANDVTDAFDIDGTGATAGIEFGFGGNGLLGVAGNYSRSQAKFGLRTADVDGRSLQLGAYASYALGPAFVQAHAGYGRTEFDISRAGVIDDLEASPDGNHVVAGAKAGFLLPLGGFRAGPVATLDYARATVDDYAEEGDAALALNVGEQRFSALVGGVGLELRGDFEAGGSALRPFASAMLEKDLRGDSRTLVFAQQSAPTVVNRFDLGERDTGVYTRFAGGASAALSDRIQLDVHASTTAGKDQGNEVSAHIGARLGF